MRRIRLFILLGITAMVLSSCSKKLIDVIVGTWNVDKIIEQVIVLGNVDEEYILTNPGTLIFEDGGTGSYSIDGDNGTFTWTVDGSDLTTNTGGFIERYDVTSIKSDELVLYQELSIFGFKEVTEIHLSRK